MNRPVSLPVADDGMSEVASGARALDAARSARATMWRAWVPALLALVLLDVTFNAWFWRIPKLTPTSADYGYQFLVDARVLAEPGPPGAPRVLALGSSVAGAFDPQQVQTLLAADGVTADVHRLLLPGIKPSDLRLYFETDGAALRPDVVAILLNPLDFLNPSFERDLKPQVRTVLPPAETLRERGAFISTWSGKLDLAAAAVSNLYRYRKPLRSAIEDHLRFAGRWLRSGSALAGYGRYADGYTAPQFALPVRPGPAFLELFIDDAWIAQRGTVTLSLATAAGPLARRTVSTPGWQAFELTIPAAAGPLLHVAADSGWSPRAAGLWDDDRLYGVRLRDAASPAPLRSREAFRYPPADRGQPDTLLRMGGTHGDEFASRWQALLEADTEFGRRFRAYRDSKLEQRDTAVTPDGEYGELERLAQLLARRGATVVLVNNPESALLRDQYAGAAYYRSYLDFLAGVAARTPGATFVDLSDALPPEDFNDWHHATYVGAIKLGPRYAALLRPLIGDGSR